MSLIMITIQRHCISISESFSTQKWEIHLSYSLPLPLIFNPLLLCFVKSYFLKLFFVENVIKVLSILVSNSFLSPFVLPSHWFSVQIYDPSLRGYKIYRFMLFGTNFFRDVKRLKFRIFLKIFTSPQKAKRGEREQGGGEGKHFQHL